MSFNHHRVYPADKNCKLWLFPKSWLLGSSVKMSLHLANKGSILSIDKHLWPSWHKAVYSRVEPVLSQGYIFLPTRPVWLRNHNETILQLGALFKKRLVLKGKQGWTFHDVWILRSCKSSDNFCSFPLIHVQILSNEFSQVD